MYIQLYLDSYSYKKLSGTLVPNCKKCRSDRLRKDGKYKEFQQYKCKDCGFRFSFTSDLPKRRVNSKIIEFAINLYITTGISLRELSKKIWKFFKTKVSHECIRLWIKFFKSPERTIEIGKTWHADETSLRVKGIVHWLWLVYDRKTIITWKISKDRDYETAKKVMIKAKEKAGKPDKIITDGLWEYIKAIKKVFGWRQKIHDRTIRAAFGSNSVIERLNREIKRRTKWFGSFQSLESANDFMREWIINYNTEKLT